MGGFLKTVIKKRGFKGKVHGSFPVVSWLHGRIRDTHSNGSYYGHGVGSQRFLAINAEAENPEEIWKFYEWLCSYEGQLLVLYGIEGVSYEMVDGYPVLTKEARWAQGEMDTDWTGNYVGANLRTGFLGFECMLTNLNNIFWFNEDWPGKGASGFPCLNMVALSFNNGLDSAKGGIWLWPRKFTLANYKAIFAEDRLIKGYFITVSRTILGTLTHLIFTYMSAYCLIHKDLPGRGLVFKLLIFSMMTGVGSVPTYIVYYQYGLVNTFWIYILPGLISIGDMVMIRAFLEGISPSLSESAQMDGCNYFRIMYKIYVTLSKPVTSVIALYSAVGH